MSINDGGPAFPCMDHLGDGDQGMSLRDYFAAKVMQAILSPEHMNQTEHGNRADSRTNINLAWTAYTVADAMLAQRAKG